MKYKIFFLNTILFVSAIQAYSSNLIWTKKADMPIQARDVCAGVVGNKIYIVNEDNSLMEYDPIGDSWTIKASMPIPTKPGLGIGVVNNKIYAVGGVGTLYNEVEEYDPAVDTWTIKAHMPIPVSDINVAVFNNRIYVFGGRYLVPQTNTVLEYDPMSDTWITKENMTTAKSKVAAVTVSSKIYVLGGEGPAGILSTVEEYDPIANTWAAKADMLSARQYFNAGVIDNNIYAIAGAIQIANLLNTVEKYDPLTNTWSADTNLPVSLDRYGLAVYDNKIYVFGGWSGASAMKTVYEASIDTKSYVLDHYDVTVPTNSISAGSNFSMSITAKNDTGDTLTSYSGNVSLQSVLASNENMAGSGVLGVTNATLASGVATINTQTYNRGETIKIKAIDSNFKVGLSSAIEFVPTYELGISLSANPSSVLTNEAAQVTAEIKDYYGSPLKNAVVVFDVIRGSGALSALTGTTDSLGRVTVAFTPLYSGLCEIRAISGNLVPATVSVNTLTLVLSANGGIVVSDDNRSSVEIPPNALSEDAVVGISRVSGVASGQGQEFEITGKRKVSQLRITDLNSAAKLVLHFNLDGSNNVANTNVNIAEVNDKLGLFYWDGVNWQKMPCTVSAAAQTVTANVTHFSRYALRGTVKPSGFSFQRVNPKPFTPNPDGVYDRAYFYYENPDNVDVGIKIYDLKGFLVRNIDVNTGSAPYWDGRDNNGRMMQGGVYIFQMKAGNKIIKDTIILAK